MTDTAVVREVYTAGLSPRWLSEMVITWDGTALDQQK